MTSFSAKVETAMQEVSAQLDLLIEKLSSFLSEDILYNIKTFTSPQRNIMIAFQSGNNPMLTINGEKTERSDLCVDNGFNILKEFHDDIGNYLKEKFKDLSLEWNVNMNTSSIIYIYIKYYIDCDTIRKYSKKIGDTK
ncbi:hypothetical protein C1645_814131 [Glomus cerebriforme]|uniref:Uncharacterized protein n=1 Tax=Glomus cerebriforme TaxID=658196 RepID=A0A397TLR2_9GLOM|nr:hypothetical protein C1645_814131 [Glomus cerebriforme]